MKTIQELKEEALLEKKAQDGLERKRLVDWIEAAIKRGIQNYTGAADLQVKVKVPGYHLYKKQGEAVLSEQLREVLDGYAMQEVEHSIDWTLMGVEKTEKSAFLMTVPARFLT